MSFQDSLASFESNVESFFVTTEHDVQAVIAKIQQDAAIAQSALDSALKWIAANQPTIVADIESALSFAAAVGATSNPEAAIVIKGAQAAVVALNAVASAQGGGASDVATLLAGYQAIQQAQAAAAQTKVAATGAVAASVTAK